MTKYNNTWMRGELRSDAALAGELQIGEVAVPEEEEIIACERGNSLDSLKTVALDVFIR